MRRRRYTRDTPTNRRALAGYQCVAVELAVEQLTKRLLDTVPEFPLTQREVELFLGPPSVIDLLHTAEKYQPGHVYRAYNVDLHYMQGRQHQGLVAWHVHVTVHGYSSNKPNAWIVPTAGCENHIPPPELVEKLHEWSRVRYRVGLAVGMTRLIVKDVLDLFNAPTQLKRVWPDLLTFMQNENEQLSNRVADLADRDCARAKMPDQWSPKWEAAVKFATHELSKASLLSETPPKRKYVTTVSRLFDARAPWSGAEIPIV